MADTREHGGTLRLDLEAEDALGFLGRVLGMLAMLSLFPLAIDIRTHEGRALDRFWLSGIGRVMPTQQSRALLERTLAGGGSACTGVRSRPGR